MNALLTREKAIKKLQGRLKVTFPACPIKYGAKTPRQQIEWEIHQKKRKLESLLRKLEKLKARFPRVIFGGRKLFNAQFNLEANGYENHDDWLNDWQRTRTSQFTYVGSKDEPAGCRLCQLTVEGRIKLQVPLFLQDQFGADVEASGVSFAYGQEYINAALVPKTYYQGQKQQSKVTGATQALTYRFVRKGKQWYIFCTTSRPNIPYQSHHRNGALGVDLNPSVIGWAYCDSSGNLKAKGQILVNLQDRNSNQIKATIGDASSELVRLAESFGCPIVIETLDFSRKKSGMKEQGIRYSRMLSNFAYSAIEAILQSRCDSRGIQLIHVNPAYSSKIGLVKFMAMYGLSSDTAAALVLARRALRKSERIPANYAFCLPEDRHKHVWSFWNALGKKLCRVRHKFFTTRGANSTTVVNLLDEPKPKGVGRSNRKPKGTSVPERNSQARIVDSTARSACLDESGSVQLCRDF